MRRLLLASALLLTACAPAAQLAGAVLGGGAALTRDGRSIVLSNLGPEALTGDPSRSGDGIALTISGTPELLLDAQGLRWCQAAQTTAGRRYACTLPELAAGERARVAWVAGDVTGAWAAGYHASTGARPVFVALR